MEHASNRIVVGVDGSACSLHALRWAVREALISGTEVTAVLVWSDPWSIVGPPSMFGAGKAGHARLRELVANRVKQAVDEEHAGAVHVEERVVAGHAAETLVAESAGARLLVVGTTGLSGIRRWMLGSVSQRCAQLSHIPVVIVPLPDGEPEFT
ncbi:MAG: universal stress protein [Acidimicrobiales bacterium]